MAQLRYFKNVEYKQENTLSSSQNVVFIAQ